MKKIALSGKHSNLFALVDDEDYAYLSQWSWHLNIDGYAQRNAHRDGKHTTVRMNREVLARKLDRPLNASEESEHQDGTILNNRRYNLRLATRSQNCSNVPIRKNSRSGLKGVHWFPHIQKWGAYIDKDSKRVFIGVFTSKEEAAYVRDQFALQLHGEFARLSVL